MVSVYDVPANELIEASADELKRQNMVKAPEWAVFVKTGVHKERPPVNPDWWYVRSASVLRTVYLRGPIGVAKLKTLYGGRKRRGHKPAVFREGSGNIARKILQQLEKSGLIATVEKPRKGRKMTAKGTAFLDKLATKIVKGELASKKRDSSEPLIDDKAKKAKPKTK